MKNLKTHTLLLLLATILITSCKKDKINNVPEEGLTVYKNIANSNNELIATYYDTYKSSTTYIYGSTDADGKGKVAKSVVYKVKGNDTAVNIILDNDLRPSIYYLSVNADEKINQLFKFEYIEGDSIKVSFYKYNWLNNTDSLMAQYTTKNNNGKVLYGSRVSSVNSEIDAWFTAAGVGMIIIGVLCPVAAGYAVAGLLSTGTALSTFGSIAGAFTTIGVHLFAWSGTGYAATVSTNIPKAPISPTATNTTIPNPVGTPENPDGSIPSFGYGGTAIWNRNGYIQELDQIACISMGTDPYCGGFEMMSITLGNLGTVQYIPRRNGTYTIGQGQPCPVSFNAWYMYCDGSGEGTITISGNSFTLDWKAPNPSGINSNCPEEGVIWHISGSWQ